ncbi:hypothetical protein D3C76_1736970 [compost metagenome]
MIHAVAGHVGFVPRALAHCAHARHDARRDFSGNAQLSTSVKYAHQIAILNATLAGIDWIQPHFLTTGCL